VADGSLPSTGLATAAPTAARFCSRWIQTAFLAAPTSALPRSPPSPLPVPPPLLACCLSCLPPLLVARPPKAKEDGRTAAKGTSTVGERQARQGCAGRGGRRRERERGAGMRLRALFDLLPSRSPIGCEQVQASPSTGPLAAQISNERTQGQATVRQTEGRDSKRMLTRR
jgi:hypothetical protein